MSSDFLIKSTASNNVGFFGIRSGEQKNRIDLGGAEDRTHRLAIAYFENIDDNLEFDTWVNYTLPSGKVVKAEIASIAARLDIPARKIIELAREDKKDNYKNKRLERAIEKKVKEYKDDLHRIKKFHQLTRLFLQSPVINKVNFEKFLSEFESFDPSMINNEGIREVCIQYKTQILTELNNLNTKCFKGKSVVQAKVKIENHLKEFDYELFHIDRNFSIKISAPENVVRTLWNSYNLVHSAAQKIGTAIGRLGIRLQLFDDDIKNRFSILTDGNVYHKKPAATKDYIPYSKDGKTWLLLSVKSLASRLYLNKAKIRASEGTDFIDKRIAQIKMCRNKLDTLIGNVSRQFKEVVVSNQRNRYTSKENWTDLFKFMSERDPLRKEFTELALFAFDALMKNRLEVQIQLKQVKAEWRKELKDKFWWDPLKNQGLSFTKRADEDFL